MTMNDQTDIKTYQIFGRKLYTEPLYFIETIKVAQETNLKEEVFQQVGESGWVELVAFPVDATLQVIPWERSP